MTNIIKDKKRIGNIILFLTLLYIMMSEWNFYEWYLKFSPINLYYMGGGLIFSLLLYIEKGWERKPIVWIALVCDVMALVVAAISVAPIMLFCFVFSVSTSFILCEEVQFSKRQFILVMVLIGIFFVYWTVDVKGYFKGYDVSYGALILLCGFMACIYILEYLRFILNKKNENFIVIGNKSNAIVLVELVAIVIGIKIILWYQSTHALLGMFLFLAVILLPRKVISNRLFYIPVIVGVCGYTSVFGIWTYIVLRFGISGVKAAILTLGLFCILVIMMMNIAKDSRSTYFAKISLAATLSIVAISSVELFIVLQPFPLILLCLGGAYSAFRNEAEVKDYSPVNIRDHTEYLKQNFISQLTISALIVFALCTQILVRIPLEVFYGNQKDMLCSLDDFYPILLCIGLVVVILGSLILAVQGKILFNFISNLMAIIVLLYYVQDMFMNVKMSESDGSPVKLSEIRGIVAINTILWIVLFTILVLLLYRLRMYNKLIIQCSMMFLIAIQIIGAISLPITIKTKNHHISYGLSNKDELSLAYEQNTIVFIMDNYGSVQADRSLEVFPDLFDGFEDFVYYTNADSVYRPTYPSLTHMMTGAKIDFSYNNAYEWLKYAWTNDKIEKYYVGLKENGVKSYLYTKDVEYEFGDSENISGKFENVIPYKHISNKKALTVQMIKMSMFRVMPYALKSKYIMNTDDINTPVELIGEAPAFEYYNWKFADNLKINGLSVDENVEKALKIYHLSGTHSPCLMDTNLNLCDKDVTNQEAAYGCMEIVRLFIDEMKEKDLYDDATIIITADHGTDEEAIDPQPIFMVKKSNYCAEKMQYNDSPISHSDLLPTYYQSFDIEYADYGTSIFDHKEDEQRERSLWFANTDKDTFAVYNYTGNREELLKKFPNNPDEIIKNKLYWTK